MSKHLLKTALRAVVAISVLAALTIQAVPSAHAAALSQVSDLLDTEQTSANTNHRMRFLTPSGIQTSDTIILTFPAGFDLTGVDFADIDILRGDSTTCSSAGYTQESIVNATGDADQWGAGVSGQIITLTAPTTTYSPFTNLCMEIRIGTNAVFDTAGVDKINNPATAQSTGYPITITGTFESPTTTNQFLVPIIAESEVQISANVNQSINFTISNPSLQFGTLLAGSTRWATSGGGAGSETFGNEIVVGTNADGGLVTTVVGGPLTSGLNTITSLPAVAEALTPGVEEFGLRVAPVAPPSQACAVVAPYNSATDYAWGANTLPQIVLTGFATTDPCSDTTFRTFYGANIATLTEAGAYTMVATWVTTGTF